MYIEFSEGTFQLMTVSFALTLIIVAWLRRK